MLARDFATQPHDRVLNQPTELADYDMWAGDTPAREALQREGGAWAAAEIAEYGVEVGAAEFLELGRLANEHDPVLVTRDRFGHRTDRVDFHPAWHTLMGDAISRGLHTSVWAEPRSGAHVARAAFMHLRHQVEQGSSCPLTMTFAVVPSLQLQPDIADAWLPRVYSREYDPRLLPAAEKKGVLFGMAMTERQGGSDVRSNSTKAEPVGAGGPGGEHRLHGHKWFCSAPMCDAFLVLAQAPGGLSCFLLPRFTPDGERNAGFRVDRLKAKVGNRSNASSEVVFDGAWAQMVGEEGRGVRTIIEMVRHTRLDCTIGGASLIRRCVAEALHHTRGRFAFGRLLVDQPLMKNVLADLCLESEAATALAFRLARSFDEATDAAAAALARIATPVAKYWVTKRETVVAREALECHGGSGFVEEAPIARLFRESPLNSVWEGAGNVQCLDALRAMQRDPEVLPALMTELREARGGNTHFDAALGRIEEAFGGGRDLEYQARRLVEQLGVALQAGLLVRFAPPAVSDAFCAARLGGDWGNALGTLGSRVDLDAIIARSLPAEPQG